MNPNEMFLKCFPETALPEERPVAKRSCALRIGPYLVFQKIVEEYGLANTLERWLGADSGLFLDLASYLIVNEDNAGQYYPDYAYCHPLFTSKMAVMSDSKVSRFFSNMKKDQIIGFLADWNAKRNHRERIYLSYDATNKNCEAGDISFVEYGKPKTDIGLPIVNVGLAFDKTNKVPLFYEEYPGSINDMSQLRFFVDKAIEYNYNHIGVILDRGYFSRFNIRYLDENHFAFILMVKGCKALVSSIIEERFNTFETKRSCHISPYRVYGTTVRSRLYPEDTRERYFHLYFSPTKLAAERTALEQKIDRYATLLKKVEGEAVELGSPYTDYFTCHHDKKGIFLFAEEKSEAIERELKLCGYFAIVTSEAITAQEAYLLYKSRDSSEKLFRADKTFLGARCMRIQTQEAMSAKLFVEFVALIIRNRIYNLLKEEMLKSQERHNFMTVPAAIKELEKIELVRRNNGLYRLDHAVTKTQRTILHSFGISDDDVRKEANAIAQAIQASDEIHQGEDDDQDENDSID